MLNTVSKGNRGFTLIELLVVVSIIAILASFAIPQYMKYRQRSSESVTSLPVARACTLDLIDYCIAYASVPGTIVGANSPLLNCTKEDVTTAYGKVKLQAKGTPKCNPDGTLTFGSADDKTTGMIAYLEDDSGKPLNGLQARCFVAGNASADARGANMKCIVEEAPQQ